MKLVTFKVPTTKEAKKSSGSESFQVKVGEIFPSVYRDIDHPLAPKGRLGFLINGTVIDAAVASMNFVMRSEDKGLLLPTLPSDIISFLALGDKAIELAQKTYQWCAKRTFEELNTG